MELIQLLFLCSVLTLSTATYIYRRPIALSKSFDTSSPTVQVSKGAEPLEHGISSVKKESDQGTIAENNLNLGVSVAPLILVPVKAEEGEHTGQGGHNSGVFGAYGSLVIPGFHINGYGGSLSAAGGLSGHYGPSHGAHVVHVGYPVHHYVGNGFANVGANLGFRPFYAGTNGILHKAQPPVNINPSGPIFVAPPKNDNQEKQPGFLEVSPNPEGMVLEQVALPPGFHPPGFIASPAGRRGYPIFMATPEQLQDISLRQNPNPFVQFFQRPFQLLQMFIRPNQANNGTKQPESPVVEGAVAESSAPVEIKPNSEEPSVSQISKQNVTVSSNQHKNPSGGEAPVTSDKEKERPKPSAAGVSDVIASVNEVVKATSTNGGAIILPVFEEEATPSAREDIRIGADDTASNANFVTSEDSVVEKQNPNILVPPLLNNN